MKRLLAGIVAALFATGVYSQEVLIRGTPQWHELLFTGGPIATLNNATGGSTLVNGTYTALATSGGSGTGATVNITVNAATCVSCTVAINNAGAAVTATGATGYLLGDSLTVPGSCCGGSGTLTFTVATLGTYSYTPVTSTVWYDAVSGGTGGAGGQNSNTGGAGGGGAGSGGAQNCAYRVTPGSAITVQIGYQGLHGAIGAGGNQPTRYTLLSGGLDNFPVSFGLTGSTPTSPTAGAGGAGGNGSPPATASGGTAGTTTTPGGNGAVATTPGGGCFVGGSSGGGGGGSNATTGQAGGAGGPAGMFQRAGGGAASGAAAGGGAGGASFFGPGTSGGTTAGGAGGACSGWGSGGAGGGSNGAGSDACPGAVWLRELY